MSEPVTRADVLKAAMAANHLVDLAGSDRHSFEEQQVYAIRALARAQIATAFATLMVAENQPLGVLGDVVLELKNIAHAILTGEAR